MGSSNKKKKEKKQDFQKVKLKVGKTQPKNANATDTSFVAKSIVLKEQSLQETAPDDLARFHLQLSLACSKNETQRKNALAYLAHTFSAHGASNYRADDAQLPVSAGAVLSKTQYLIMDESAAVRANLLKLFRSLPFVQLSESDLRRATLQAYAAMTHLAASIRADGLQMLAWLLEAGGETVLGTPGTWFKGLQTFQGLLSWHNLPVPQQSGVGGPTVTKIGSWTSSKPSASKSNSHDKLSVAQLKTLAGFLKAGLAADRSDAHGAGVMAAHLYPLWHTDAHLGSSRSNALEYLNLFGANRNVENQAYETFDERLAVFKDSGFHSTFHAGVQEAKREGGELGRAGSGIEKILEAAVSVV